MTDKPVGQAFCGGCWSGFAAGYGRSRKSVFRDKYVQNKTCKIDWVGMFSFQNIHWFAVQIGEQEQTTDLLVGLSL